MLNPPSGTGAVGSAAGGTLPNATYYFQVTALNPWGETMPTAEGSYVAGGGGTSSITFTPAPLLPPGATSYRVYIDSGVPGGEVGYFASVGLAPLTVMTLTGLLPGTVPVRSSAWMPDSDGSFVSASTIFRWLNDALRKAGRIGGGIPYLTAIQAIAGQGYYRITGKWINLTNIWFDGWPVTMGRRGDQFLHNTVSSIPGILSIEEYSDTTLIQLWPQPNRSGNATTLTAPMTATDTVLTVASAANFLSTGLCLIDNEIIGYTVVSATQLLNLFRGVNGTIPAAHLSAAPTVEANIRISGFRQPTEYSVGQSALTLPLIPGWEVPIADYINAQYKKAENQDQEAAALENQFESAISKMAKDFRGKTRSIQIGDRHGIETYGGSISGGIILQ